jgi:hypothetical protein
VPRNLKQLGQITTTVKKLLGLKSIGRDKSRISAGFRWSGRFQAARQAGGRWLPGAGIDSSCRLSHFFENLSMLKPLAMAQGLC